MILGMIVCMKPVLQVLLFDVKEVNDITIFFAVKCLRIVMDSINECCSLIVMLYMCLYGKCLILNVLHVL